MRGTAHTTRPACCPAEANQGRNKRFIAHIRDRAWDKTQVDHLLSCHYHTLPPI